MLCIDRIGLRSQMRQHVVSATGGALVPKCCDINWCHDDALTGPGSGLGEDSPVVIDDLTATRPRIWGILREAGALVGSHHVGDVLKCPTPVHHRPPVHRLGGTPW